MTTITPGNHPETVTLEEVNEFGQYTLLTEDLSYKPALL